MLHCGVKQSSEVVVDLILTKVPHLMDTQNEQGSSPLMRAAEKDHLSVIQLLLSYKANVRLKNNEENTALHCVAIQINDDLNTLIYFPERGQAILKRQIQHIKIMKTLLAFGANFELKNNQESNKSLLDYLNDGLKIIILHVYGLMIVGGIKALSAFKANFITRDKYGQLQFNAYVGPAIES